MTEPPHPDLAAQRVDYDRDHLVEVTLPADPLVLFDRWLGEAFTAEAERRLAEPTAMVVSTVAGGRPSSRTVLLKELDAEGFCFYTNYASRKGRELAAEPQVALLFGWYALQRQVRIEGTAERMSREESEAYFATRPRGSQLGAWASHQSAEATMPELEQAYAEREQRFAGGDVPCPPFWGGIRVRPDTIEFWQGRPSRMHDRIVYRRDKSSVWATTRLAP